MAQTKFAHALIVLILMIVLTQAACTTKGSSGEIEKETAQAETMWDVACLLFQPVTYSLKDTEKTIQEIKAHNVKFLHYCNMLTKVSGRGGSHEDER
ncbi:MAG: hypothetical protein N4A65_01500 [Cohaesibacter sp.]|jgi:hypothetical protein|nr:hypothetical protein [Cohaesibacter sp.]